MWFAEDRVLIKTTVKVSHGGKCLKYKYYRGIKSVDDWINLRLKVSIGADDVFEGNCT